MEKTSDFPPTPIAITTRAASGDDFFNQAAEITNKIAERAYELYQIRGSIDGFDQQDWLTAESEILKPVPLEIQESEESFLVFADVPGFNAGHLAIEIDGPRLLLHATQDPNPDLRAADFGGAVPRQILRTIELSQPALAAEAHAELKNGVLRLTLPKPK
ncbi:MAG TPA: DUF2934 domain-containing protein [Candidatus Angelobacter sp.]|nr:DUF2934 domain-containing protein [Candidatus Angelobacter sp.]